MCIRDRVSVQQGEDNVRDGRAKKHVSKHPVTGQPLGTWKKTGTIEDPVAKQRIINYRESAGLRAGPTYYGLTVETGEYSSGPKGYRVLRSSGSFLLELLDTNDDQKIDYWKENTRHIKSLANDLDFDGRADKLQMFYDEFTIVGIAKTEPNPDAIFRAPGENVAVEFDNKLILSESFKKKLKAIDPGSPSLKPGDTIYAKELFGESLNAEDSNLPKITDDGILDSEIVQFDTKGLGIEQLEYLMTTVFTTMLKHHGVGESANIRLEMEK